MRIITTAIQPPTIKAEIRAIVPAIITLTFLDMTASHQRRLITRTAQQYCVLDKEAVLLLEDYTEGIVLAGNVYIDETYYNETASNRNARTGKELRGISKNKYCIAIGSHLIHDREKSHKVLVEELELSEERYNACEIEKLPDKKNPLAPINPHQCFMLKDFLNAHQGFSRKDLQGYLNLFCFMQNPPHDKL